jgi:RND family efflux transporter MFP subunit
MKNSFWILLILLISRINAVGAQVPVGVEPARIGSISLLIPFSGEVKPFAEAYLTPDVGGRVQQVTVENGQKVTAGDALIHLEKERRALEVRKAEVNLKMAQQRLDEARKDFERKKVLFDKKVLSDKVYDEAETGFLTAQSTLKAAQVMLDLEKLNLERSLIRAPITGIFTNRQVEPGQGVAAGMTLGTIIQIDRVKVVAKIPETTINQVKVGQQVFIQGDGVGKVLFINPYGDASRAFAVEIEVPNTEQILKPRMFVKGDIQVEFFDGVPLVPTSAVLTEDGRQTVYLVEGTGPMKAVRRVVQLLARVGEHCLVRPMAIGERVVTVGAGNLSDGTAITITNQAESTEATK